MSRKRVKGQSPNNKSTRTLPVEPDPLTKSQLLALVAVLLIGTVLRFWYLDQPIRYDEAVTYLTFVRLPWLEVIADYRAPNNHILNTLLVKGVVQLFGSTPALLRLPALVAGIAIMPLTFLTARRLCNNQVALLGTALVAGSGALTLFSTNARGYTMVVAASLLLVRILLSNSDAPRPWHWPLYSLTVALGFWAVPTMLYPLKGIGLWLILRAWQQRSAVSPWWHALLTPFTASLVGFGLAGLLYLPVIWHSGIGALTANSFVRANTDLAGFVPQVFPGVAATAQLFSLGIGPLVAGSLLLLVVIGTWQDLRDKSDGIATLLLSMLVASLLVQAVIQRMPYARVWLFIWPIAAIAVAVALWCIVRRLLKQRAGIASEVLAVGVTLSMAGSLAVNGGMMHSAETGALPDSPAIIGRLAQELHPGDQLMVGTVTYAILEYEMARHGIDHQYLDGDRSRVGRYLVVVNTLEGETPDIFLARFKSQSRSYQVTPLAAFPSAQLLAVTAQ